jgi:hypothetical protein
MKLLIMQFSPPLYYVIQLWSKYFIQDHFFKYP